MRHLIRGLHVEFWHNDVVKLRGEQVVASLRELSEYLNLTEQLLGGVLGVKQVFDEFDSDILAGLHVPGLHNIAKASLANLSSKRVLLRESAPIFVDFYGFI